MPDTAAVAPEPLAYSVRETARLLSVSSRTIYNLIEAGTLPVVVLGGRRLIPRQAIEQIIATAMTTERDPR